MTAPSSRPAIPVRTAIGLDIGGTKIAGGVVADDGTLLNLLEVATPAAGDGPGTLEVLRQIIGSRFEYGGVETPRGRRRA